jgi:hypothetical protein
VEAANNSNNLSELELAIGDLTNATIDADRSVKYADLSGSIFERISDRTTRADSLHQAGRHTEAKEEFTRAEEMQAGRQPDYPILFGVAGFQYCDLLLAEAEGEAWWQFLFVTSVGGTQTCCGEVDPEVFLRACQSLEWVTVQNWHLDIGLDNLTLGRIALYLALLENAPINLAHRHLDQSVMTLRSSAHQIYIPRSLLSRAWLRVLERDPIGGCADLDEAWDIAERGPMLLHLADIHLHRACLFFREKHYPWKSPQDDLAAAEKLINDCGYHRRDEELADAKRAILGV